MIVNKKTQFFTALKFIMDMVNICLLIFLMFSLLLSYLICLEQRESFLYQVLIGITSSFFVTTFVSIMLRYRDYKRRCIELKSYFNAIKVYRDYNDSLKKYKDIVEIVWYNLPLLKNNVISFFEQKESLFFGDEYECLIGIRSTIVNVYNLVKEILEKDDEEKFENNNIGSLDFARKHWISLEVYQKKDQYFADPKIFFSEEHDKICNGIILSEYCYRIYYDMEKLCKIEGFE